ncbi:metalloendoproteinase 3-MMP-like [Eucalyptus grandis]|uniref:metalloendoproteinase 3-MMP-like n=1 Tax=Eucalyptus grandis TaxID=71139 RepID=UPI00192EE3F3|nr:metalloendoproteinase 3-MMP-like [Eucalyptus grandis]
MVLKMMMPRCGVSDIVNGTTWMEPNKKGQNLREARTSVGIARWPASNYHLTCGMENRFKGPGGTIAHDSPPTSRPFRYDADVRWSVNPPSGSPALDLEAVTFRGIGHLVGLGHSGVGGSVTYSFRDPTYQGQALYDF